MDNSLLFISYAREYIKPVQRIVRELNKYGFETWFDGANIIGGTAFADEIEQGIDDCGLFLFMQSPDAVASIWTAKECDRAKQAGKPILPVLVSTIDLDHNRFPDLHWIDYVDCADGDKFDYAMFELIRAIDNHTAHPACPAALEKIQKRLGPTRIAENVEEIRRNTISAQKWLDEINTAHGMESKAWSETDRTERAGKLVALATGESIRDPQIIAYASQTIARTGNMSAVREMASSLVEGGWQKPILDSLRTVWETRDDGLPASVMNNVKWMVRRFIAWYHISTPPAVATLIACLIGSCLAIMFAINANFGDGQGGVQFLGRWSDTISTGVSYGIFIGAGIALTFTYIPRLRILMNWQYVLAPAVGWAVVFGAFWVMNFLFKARISPNWDNFTNIAGLSLLFISGFAASNLVRPSSVLATLLRMAIAFAGVFLAIRIPCEWSLLQARLLTLYPDDCAQQSLIIAAAVVVPAFLPEFWRNMIRRRSLFPRPLMRLARALKR